MFRKVFQYPLTALNVQVRNAVLSSTFHHLEGHSNVVFHQRSGQLLRIQESRETRKAIFFITGITST